MADLQSPAVYPTITINDRVLVVKFGLYAEYVCSKAGFDTAGAVVKLRNKTPESLFLMLELFAASVSENFRKSHEPAPTAEDWAVAIPEGQFKEVADVTMKALVKALRSATQPATPAAEVSEAPQAPLQ